MAHNKRETGELVVLALPDICEFKVGYLIGLRLNVRPRPRRRKKGMPMPDAPTAPNQLLSSSHSDACEQKRFSILLSLILPYDVHDATPE